MSDQNAWIAAGVVVTGVSALFTAVMAGFTATLARHTKREADAVLKQGESIDQQAKAATKAVDLASEQVNLAKRQISVETEAIRASIRPWVVPQAHSAVWPGAQQHVAVIQEARGSLLIRLGVRNAGNGLALLTADALAVYKNSVINSVNFLGQGTIDRPALAPGDVAVFAFDLPQESYRYPGTVLSARDLMDPDEGVVIRFGYSDARHQQTMDVRCRLVLDPDSGVPWGWRPQQAVYTEDRGEQAILRFEPPRRDQ